MCLLYTHLNSLSTPKVAGVREFAQNCRRRAQIVCNENVTRNGLPIHLYGVIIMRAYGVRAKWVHTSFIQRQNEIVIFLVELCAIYSKHTHALIDVAHMIDYRFTVHFDADITYPSTAVRPLTQSHGLAAQTNVIDVYLYIYIHDT